MEYVKIFIMNESVYFKELHNQQEYYWPTIYRTGAAVVSTITSIYLCFDYWKHKFGISLWVWLFAHLVLTEPVP